MADFFAPKDIESLNKLASLMVVPFFGAAMFVDFGFWLIHQEKSEIVLSLFNSESTHVRFVFRAILFLMGVGITALVQSLVDDILLVHAPKLAYFVALSLLSFGVLGIGHLAEPTPIGTVNLFWHLGCLCWGLSMFDFFDKISKRTNT